MNVGQGVASSSETMQSAGAEPSSPGFSSSHLLLLQPFLILQLSAPRLQILKSPRPLSLQAIALCGWQL